MTKYLQKAIETIIKGECDSGTYAEKFSPEFQTVIKDNAKKIATNVLEDKEGMQLLTDNIEESIRIFALHSENK